MRRVVVLIGVLVAAVCVPAAWAHDDDVSTVAGHDAVDDVTLTPAQEQALNRHTIAQSARAAWAAEVDGNAHDAGEWGPVVDWPVVGVHVALLPNGKVLAYDSVGDAATETFPDQTFTRATVWDPNATDPTKAFTPVTETGSNIFCSGLAHLVDGRIFIAGGNKNQHLDGIVQTHLFNPATNTWSLGPNIKYQRWSPTVRVRLSLRRVRPGRYRLRAWLAGGRTVVLSRSVVVVRAHAARR